MILYVPIFIVTIALMIHNLYYILIFYRLAFFEGVSKNKIKAQKHTIVICYKNEGENISNNFGKIKAQKSSEIILVDDNSKDDTNHLLKKYKSKCIKVEHLQSEYPGKKEALKRGISLSTNDRIVLTDADCKPASSNWSQIMANYSESFVLGYAPMNKGHNAVSSFAQYETYLTAIQYLGYALAGMPYMGVGRNMAINKTVVENGQQNVKGNTLASGDDDLMVNALATQENTTICIEPASFVYSPAKSTWNSFFRQKLRHISTSIYYKKKHQNLLAIFSLTQILFYSFLILGIFLGTISSSQAFIFLSIKWGIQMVVNSRIMKRLGEEDLFWKTPVLDFCMFIYYIFMPFYYLKNKKTNTWN